MNTKLVMHVSVTLLMAFHFFFGALVIERMAGLAGGHTALFVYRILSLAVVGAACLWVATEARDFTLPAFGWFLALLVPFGLIVGLSQGHGGQVALSHVVQALTALTGFTAGYVFLRQGLNLWGVLKISSFGLFATVAGLLLVYFIWVWYKDVPIRHYSLDFFGLLIPFAYFLAKRRLWWALATFALMILVGKRGVGVAGVVMFAWWCFEARWRNYRSIQHLQVSFSDAIALLIAAVIFLAWSVAMNPFGITAEGPASDVTQNIPAPDVATPAIDSIGLTPIGPNYMMDRYTNFSDLNALSGMRGDLISSVVQMLDSDPIRWWLGAGFGSSFVFSHSHGTVEVVMYGVDIMPIHFVMLYGIPLTIAIFAYFSWVLLTGWLSVRRAPDTDGSRPTKVALMAVLIGYLVCAMFTFPSIDPTFWFFLGAAVYIGRPGEARKSFVPALEVPPNS